MAYECGLTASSTSTIHDYEYFLKQIEIDEVEAKRQFELYCHNDTAPETRHHQASTRALF